MDKTIWLILVATVAIIVALAVIFMSQSSIGDTIDNAEQTRLNGICETQCDAVESGNRDSVDPKCQTWAESRDVSCGG